MQIKASTQQQKQINSAHFGNTEGPPALATIHSECSSCVVIAKAVPFTKRPDLRNREIYRM